MAMIDLTFETIICRDCGHEAPGANLLSASSFAPPPNKYSYDGRCPKCGSSNTTVLGETKYAGPPLKFALSQETTLDFVPPPSPEDFESEDAYKQAKKAWEKEFQKAQKFQLGLEQDE